jgi:hypothetical protein
MTNDSRGPALWLSLVVVSLHNLEEHLTMGSFLAAHRDELPSILRPMTGERFAVSLVIFTLLALVVTWAAARSRPNGPWLVLAIALQAGFGVNALQHAGIAVWAGGYAPGVVTGLGLCLPYAVYLVRRAVRDGWVAVKPLMLASAAVILLSAPILMAVHAVSTMIR